MTRRSVVVALFVIFLFQIQLSSAQDSLDLKIGQMILIGIPPVPTIDARVLEGIKQGKVGSVIFFERNIPAKNSYAELKKLIWTYQQASTIPLFVAIDQEGGKVNRLKEKYGFPRSVTAAKLGKYSLDSVQFYSQTTAATLAGLGFNVNFAPVVDVASNPNNPVIAKVERSYSSQPDSVALFAQEVIEAHQKLGIVTVLKHFPGHGSSKDDTHLGVADVTKTWDDSELLPYQRLIDSARIDAVMTAHIVNKKLDDTGLPGTLSKKMVTGMLRNTLHFNGVVFTDDMQMHAITKHFPLEQSIQLTIEAGVDVLLFSNNIQGSEEYTIDKVHGIIRNLVERGVISKERIDQSFRRIMELKRKMNGSMTDYYRTELVKATSRLAEMEQKVKQNESLARVAEAEARKYQQQYEELKNSGKKKKTKKSN